MEEMYQEYQQIAEFRIVYISEAHAVDDSRPTPFARLKGIFEHQDYGQRCSTAEMMMQEENITIPCVIDEMDNQVSRAYNALPDRVFVVDKDGKLAIASNRGPSGFRPALKETREWLSQYRASGHEPEPPPN